MIYYILDTSLTYQAIRRNKIEKKKTKKTPQHTGVYFLVGKERQKQLYK